MVHISNHPLLLHKISKIRDKNTSNFDFRRTMKEIAMLLGYEILSGFPTKDIKVKTPLATANCKVISKDIVIVAILRAGLGLMDGLLEIIPEAKQAHIGIYRDEETLKPVKYYLRFPDDLKDKYIIIVDPMLATGGSAVEAVNIVKSRGAKNIHFMSVISSKYGVDVLRKHHPDIKIFTAVMDEKINENGYIVPGLGDAGDRMFGTD
ncbi:MAG: uracil phosphoribosyltransferase [Elusimicrobiales bacterium]|nr:uracil phosphoribosyltransferase [Elusimicrobiales bacterium]HPO96292.1 uracil phosphoribosyltransferase [Elusimicrobiales bacterium]